MTFLRRFGVLVLGVVLVLLPGAFAVIFATPLLAPGEALVGTTSFGWTAYAPLTQTTFVPPGLGLYSVGAATALVVFCIGLILIAGWVGFRLGRRAPSSR